MNNFLAFSFSWVLENLNLIIILTFAGYGVYGLFKGFFGQLAGALATLIAIIIATMFSKALYSVVVKATPVDDFFLEKFSLWANNRFPSLKSVDAGKLSETVSSLPFPSIVKNTLNSLAGTADGGTVDLCMAVAQTFANYATLIICFVILFIAVKLILFFFRKMAKQLRTFTGFRLTDSAFGICLSLFQAFRFFSGIFFVVNFIPFSFMDTLKGAVADSSLATLITNYNLYAWLFGLIQL